MQFEVRIATTTVQTIKIDANSIAHAEKIARSMDKKREFFSVTHRVAGKKIKAYLRCPQCNKPTQLYLSDAFDERGPLCVACFEKSVRGASAQQRVC